jgi:hypothetical protein
MLRASSRLPMSNNAAQRTRNAAGARPFSQCFLNVSKGFQTCFALPDFIFMARSDLRAISSGRDFELMVVALFWVISVRTRHFQEHCCVRYSNKNGHRAVSARGDGPFPAVAGPLTLGDMFAPPTSNS